MVNPAVRVDINARDRTRTAFASAGQRIKNFDRLAGGVGRSLAAGFGATALTAGVAAFGRSIAATINRLDEIDKAARAAGVPPEVLQSWRLFGEQSGATANQVDTSLRRIRRRTGEAVAGGEVAKQFRALGVEVVNLDGSARNTSDVMADLVDSLANAEDKTTAFANAIRIGDIEFARFAQGIIDNGANARELFATYERAGVIIDSAVIQKAVEAKDALTLATGAFQAQKDIMVGEFVPALNNLSNVILPFWTARLREAREALQDLFDTRGSSARETLLDQIEEVRDDIEELSTGARAPRNAYRLPDFLGGRSFVGREGFEQALVELRASYDRLNTRLERLNALTDDVADKTGDIKDDTNETAVSEAQITLEAERQLQAKERQRRVQDAMLRIQLEQLKTQREAGTLSQEDYDRQVAALNRQRAALQGIGGGGTQANDLLSPDPAITRITQAVENLATNRRFEDGLAMLLSLDLIGRAPNMLNTEELEAYQRILSELSKEERELLDDIRELDPSETLKLAGLLGGAEARLAAIVQSKEQEAEFRDLVRQTSDYLLMAGFTQEEINRLLGEQVDAGTSIEEVVRLQNEALNRQLTLVNNIGFTLSSFEDSTEGWIRTLGDALTIWSQFRQQGGTDILGALGDVFTGRLPGRRYGGPVTAGRAYVVGEGGYPELFIPQVSGVVAPISAGGSRTVVFHNTIHFTGQDLGPAVDGRLIGASDMVLGQLQAAQRRLARNGGF